MDTLGYYAVEMMRLIFNFQEFPLSFEIEADAPEDLLEHSPKFKLLEFLNAYLKVENAVHLNADALKDVMRAKEVSQSQVAQALSKLNPDRAVFNLNAANTIAEKYNAQRPSELSTFLKTHPSSYNPAKRKDTTIVLLYNPDTHDAVCKSLDYHAGRSDVAAIAFDLGLMICPAKPNAESFKEFKPIDDYGIASRHMLNSYEYAGALGPDNIYAAVEAMNQAGIRSPKLSTRGGVMRDKIFDFDLAHRFLSEIRKFQKQYK